MKAITTFSLVAAATLSLACGGGGEKLPRATLLSSQGANDRTPIFSPDGKRVVYWADGSNGAVLTVASADLSHPITLDSSLVLTGSAATWSPDASTIAYTAGPNIDLWTVPSSGGTPHRLTSSKGFEIPIAWNPSGKALAYLATGAGGTVQSGEVDVATGASRPVIPETRPVIPFWSPDGSHIAYMMIDGDKTTIWVADSVGQHRRQLTNEGFEMFASAVSPWSPDGKRLAYQSNRTGMLDVWVVDVATDSLHQLTRDVRNDQGPEWSPDGSWIAFLSDRGRQTDVWMVPSAGGRPERVTDNPAVENDLQWIPGTTHLAYTTGATLRSLWNLPLNDSTPRRLTPDSIVVAYPAFSPDRKTVAFQIIRGGGVGDLAMMPTTGGPIRTLVSNGASNETPRWSPDGTKVAYASDKTGNTDIWVVDTADGAPRDLTGWSGDERNPEWAPDGSVIYFSSNRDTKPISDLWKVAPMGGTPQRVTHIGAVQKITFGRHSDTPYVLSIGGSEGQFVLSTLNSDGTLKPLWDATFVYGIASNAEPPSGDSVAIAVQRADGSVGMMLLSLKSEKGRPLLGSRETLADWSADGSQMLYYAGTSNSDLYLAARDGSAPRRLTNTPADEGCARFLPDQKTILFCRTTTTRRIATVDVGRLMAEEK